MESSKMKVNINFGFSGDHPMDLRYSEMYDIIKRMNVTHEVVHNKEIAIWTVDAEVTDVQRKQLMVHAENLGCLVTW